MLIPHYVKIAYRNLVKHRLFSLINVVGLSLGIAGCLLILTYIGYERSYDGYHRRASDIYRIASRTTASGQTTGSTRTPAPVGPTMVQDFPEVIDAVRFSPTVKRVFAFGDKNFFQDGVLYVDRSVFDVFSWELIEGDPATALEAPFTMVVTETTARKIFGDESPVGKFVKWDNKFDYRVTGVVKDPPSNSHFTFTVLASFATFIAYDPRIGAWDGGSFPTYLLLRDGTDPRAFEPKMKGFYEHYLGPRLKERGVELTTYLQPLRSIHLRSRLQGELGDNGDIRIVNTFGAIALLIVLIACINYMNLATARAAGRIQEVGVRKVLGAPRKDLVGQFLGESFVLALLSTIVAVLVARLALPYFAAVSGKALSFGAVPGPQLYAGLAAIVLVVGLVAGSYPAIFLSSFKPITALRNWARRGPRSALVRSGLVVFQFAASVLLVIGTIVILAQHRYLRTMDLGFDKSGVLAVALQNDEVRIGLESLKQELLTIPGVEHAGASSMVPGEMYLFNQATSPEGFPKDQTVRMDNFLVDDGFLETMGIAVVKGRPFSKDMAADFKSAVMINETAARRLGWDDPVGKTIEVPSGDGLARKSVIGVFRDIHQRSLYSAVAPTYIEYIGLEGAIENRARRLVLRLGTEDLPGTMALIERKWKEAFPHHPFYAFFIDEFFDAQHRAEGTLGSLFRTFALLAVGIGLLGLLGLVSFTTEQRTKEIGIRKVLGSTSEAIVVWLCRKFVLLVALANVLAWPVAFFVLRNWLQRFPYPVTLGAGPFVLTACGAFLAALLTVSVQTIRAARASPVDSLRYE
jgi:putative ABC transport system permease protein